MSNLTKATDQVMSSAQETAKHNPMRPPSSSPNTARQALRVFWTHRSPLTLLAAALTLMTLRWQVGPFGWSDVGLVLGVWALFPMNEWLVHVVMLHYRPRQFGKFTLDFYLPKTHRRHHADPWNLDWVFIPRHVHVMVLGAMAIMIWLAGPWRTELLTVLCTYLILGIHYEWVHYLTHITWCPPLAYYQGRVFEHRLHHFRNENYWWGVSMGLGDRLMGTAPDVKTTGRSGSNRDLGMTP